MAASPTRAGQPPVGHLGPSSASLASLPAARAAPGALAAARRPWRARARSARSACRCGQGQSARIEPGERRRHRARRAPASARAAARPARRPARHSSCTAAYFSRARGEPGHHLHQRGRRARRRAPPRHRRPGAAVGAARASSHCDRAIAAQVSASMRPRRCTSLLASWSARSALRRSASRAARRASPGCRPRRRCARPRRRARRSR